MPVLLLFAGIACGVLGAPVWVTGVLLFFSGLTFGMVVDL